MYPKENINPKDKANAWLMQYAKQAWNDGTAKTPGIFYGAAAEYDLLKKYAIAQQPTAQYMKPYVDEQGNTWTKLDQTIRPVISKYRDIAITKLQQREFNITATPIDAIAKDDADKYFAEAKVKILMRDQLKQTNPEMLDAPAVKQEDGEAEDLEELEMQMGYTWKHNMAIEAEESFQLVAYQNDLVEERRQTIINEYDLGVGGYKEWTDDNGKVKLRDISPQNIICSYCRRPDFKDATHIGEIIEVDLDTLPFNPEQLEKIKSATLEQYAYQPVSNNLNRDKTKIQVLDLEIKSIDEKVFSQRIDQRGNLVFGQSKYDKKQIDATVTIDGKEEPKYSTRSVQNIYKVKWIIGTDFVYDTGISTNQKRDNSNPANTCFSYHMYAYNFYNMTAVSYMKRLKPTLDEYQATVLKIQHFKNKWIPYIINVDMEALEGVALGKGGANMSPLQLLDMIWQTNVALNRRSEISAGNVNFKPIEVLPTPMVNEFMGLIGDLQRLNQELSDTSGFNALTDGSTPNAKTLVPVANFANESTNNAIFPVTYAEKNILERLAKGVIQRIQLSVKNGKGVQGIIHALGTNTVKFIKVSPDLALHEFGIMIEDKPTDQEKAMLLQYLNIKNSEGKVDPDVYFMVNNSNNLKQTEQMLVLKIKKKAEKEQQDAIAMQQQNGQIQVQSAQAAEQAKQDTITLEYKLKGELELKLKNIDFDIAKLKIKGATDIAETNSTHKIATTMLGHDSAERQSKIEQGIPVDTMEQPPVEPVGQPDNSVPVTNELPQEQTQDQLQ